MKQPRSKIAPMLSSESDEWGSPRPLFESVDRSLGLTLDAAARADQHMLPRFITKKENALRRSWAGERHWLNFPYSKAKEFTSHARAQAMEPESCGAWLAPVRPDTEWWRRFVLSMDGAAGRLLFSRFVLETGALWLQFERLTTGVRWLKGRLTFELPPGSEAAQDPAPFPSAIIIQAHPHVRPLIEGTEWTLGWP